VSAKNLHSRLGTLDRSFGNRPLDQLGPSAIRDWLETIGHMSAASRRAYLSTVRTFARWLVAEELVKRDPTKGIERVKEPRRVPRAINAREVAALLGVCPDRRARAIVWLMVGCGLRCVEVARLSDGDYDEREGTIVVRGKGSHERVLPVPLEVQAAIAAYRRQHGRGTGPLIRSHHNPGAGIGHHTISKNVSTWFALAGLKGGAYDGRSAHALRHTAASDVLDHCQDVRVVQQMLGHANVSTTSVYLRRAKLGELREAMEGRPYSSEGTVIPAANDPPLAA